MRTDKEVCKEGMWIISLWNFPCLMRNLGIWCCKTEEATISGTTSLEIDVVIKQSPGIALKMLTHITFMMRLK